MSSSGAKPQTDKEWQAELSPEQYRIMRERGTEAPFSGEYVHEQRAGVYRCAACNAELFSSDTKFDSGTGWPSFTEATNRANVDLIEDASYGMVRTEVRCKTCGSHLGHVFPDGPGPKGERYCINSACLRLEPRS